MATLYSYYRSSSSYRVRIALNLKQVVVELKSVNIHPAVDEQHGAEFLEINPQGRVPFFQDAQVQISQSTAIIEYLDETYPGRALLPNSVVERAYVRQLVNIINADIQPLNNLAVLSYLKSDYQIDQNKVNAWYSHWLTQGFSDFELILKKNQKAGDCCCGNEPSMADIYLIPQVWNALRFNVDMQPFPNIMEIFAHCNTLSEFNNAAPENQPDNPDS